MARLHRENYRLVHSSVMGNGEIVNTDGVFCVSSDCCGASKTICAETTACKDVVCEEDEKEESSASASFSTFFALVVIALGLLI